MSGDTCAGIKLRAFILGTGEHGLGMEYVWSLSHVEFEEYWVIHQAVCDMEKNPEEYRKKQSLRRVIDMEKTGTVPRNGVAFDPETASPEEVDRWLRSLRGESNG